MAKFCDRECERGGGYCDHSKHYQDSGNDDTLFGYGSCLLWNISVSSSDVCDDFHCRLAKEDAP